MRDNGFLSEILDSAGIGFARFQDGKLVHHDQRFSTILDLREGRSRKIHVEDFLDLLESGARLQVEAFLDIKLDLQSRTENPAKFSMKTRIFPTSLNSPINVHLTVIRKNEPAGREEISVIIQPIGPITTKERDIEMLDDLQTQMSLERLIAKISTDLINLGKEDLDFVMKKALNLIGTTLDADFCTLHVLKESNLSHGFDSWYRRDESIPSIRELRAIIESDKMPWIIQNLENSIVVAIQDIMVLPSDARKDGKILEEIGVKSLIAVPISTNGDITGVLILAYFTSSVSWSEDIIFLLRLAGEMFMNTLQRRQSEMFLLESEKKFRGIFEQSSSLIILLAADGSIIDINPAATRLLGVQEDDVVGKKFTDIPSFSTALMDEYWHFFNQVLDGKDFPTITVKVEHQSGKILHLQTKSSRLILPGGAHVLIIANNITSQKIADQKIRESQERFSLIFNKSHDLLFMASYKEFEEKFLTIWMNEAWQDVFGSDFYGFEDLLGIIHSDASEKFKEIVSDLKARDMADITKLEHRARKKNGENINLETNIIKVNMDDTCLGFISAHDISDRKDAERLLKTSEHKFRSLYEESNDAILILDLEGRILDINKEASEMLGISPAELHGRQVMEFHLEKYKPMARRALEQLKKQGDVRFSSRLQRANGDKIDVDINAKKLPIDNGIIQSIIRDVTHIRKALDLLQLNQDRLEALLKIHEHQFENEDDFIEFVLEYAVRLTSSKGGYFHLFSGDTGQVNLFKWSNEVRRECTTDFPSHYPIEDAGIWADCIRQRRAVIHNDYENYYNKHGLPEGHYSFTRHLAIPLLDGNDIVGVIGVGNKRDPYNQDDVQQLNLFAKSMFGILKQRRAEKALIESERALKHLNDELEQRVEQRTKELREAQQKILRQQKLATIGKLAGSISHELRNPLGIMNNSLYYLNMKLGDVDEKIQRHLDILKEELERASLIIKDMLTFTKLKKLLLIESNVNDIIHESLQEFIFPEGITIDDQLSPGMPDLKLDPIYFKIALQNLLINAIQAMEGTGTIIIRTRKEGGNLLIEIADTGPGIPAGNISKIFEPLFTTKLTGIGLGLSIVKEIINKHGGMVMVENLEPRGALFKLIMPVN